MASHGRIQERSANLEFGSEINVIPVAIPGCKITTFFVRVSKQGRLGSKLLFSLLRVSLLVLFYCLK